MAKSGAPLKGKPGPSSVDEASKGSNPSGGSGGSPGKSMPQKPIPGSGHGGLPPSIKKALAKKTLKGGDATGAAGLVR
jgi:hypothetical protein